MAEEPSVSAADLLSKAGVRDSIELCERLNHGGNNRAYKVLAGGRPYLLKEYFSHIEDTHDRQGAEYQFLEFCIRQNIRPVPRPLAAAPPLAALFTWVEGCALDPTCIDATSVDEAASFLSALAMASGTRDGLGLRLAADACTCLHDHIRLTRERVTTLQQSLKALDCSEVVLEANVLLEQGVVPALSILERDIFAKLGAEALFRPLAQDRYIVSPSDFGFHNALRTEQGLVFVDFEYAGRDDPVKTLCDFVCQPALPPPQGCMAQLASAVYGDPGAAEQLLETAELFLPLHRLKWVCIMLNEFRHSGACRRMFARNDVSLALRRAAQLEKARQYFSNHVSRAFQI